MAENALIAALRSASNSAPAEDSGVTSYEMPALGSASPLAIRKSAGLLNPVDFSKQRQEQGSTPNWNGYEPWYVQWLRSQIGKKGGVSASNPLTQIASGAAGIGGGLLASNLFGGVAPSIDFTASAYAPNYTPTDVGDLSGYDPSQPFVSIETIPDFSAPVYQPTYTPTEVGDLSGYNPEKPFTFEDSTPAPQSPAPAPASVGIDLASATPAQSADYALAQVLPDLPIAPSAIGSQAGADAISGALRDFSGLTNAQSADAALAASLTPTVPAYVPSPVYTPDFTSATSIYNPDVASSIKDFGDLSGYNPANPFVTDTLTTGSNLADFGLGALGTALVTNLVADSPEGQLGGALGGAALSAAPIASALGLGGIGWVGGPVGALMGAIAGEMLSGPTEPPLVNPLTGATVQPGSEEYAKLEPWYERNFNVPEAINSYSYSPEDMARLAGEFYNPTDATAANVAGITQNATGLTYNPMTREELAQSLAPTAQNAPAEQTEQQQMDDLMLMYQLMYGY